MFLQKKVIVASHAALVGSAFSQLFGFLKALTGNRAAQDNNACISVSFVSYLKSLACTAALIPPYKKDGGGEWSTVVAPEGRIVHGCSTHAKSSNPLAALSAMGSVASIISATPDLHRAGGTIAGHGYR